MHKNIKQHNTDNNEKKVSWAANQHIMISQGSCDTEDWSNDAENPALSFDTGINWYNKKQVF